MNSRKNNYQLGWLLIVAVVVLCLRLIPHAPNFAALGALAILSGYYWRSSYSWLLPLVIVFISDLVIGTYSWPIMLSVYFSYYLMAHLGGLAGHKQSGLSHTSGKLVLTSLGGSTIFFLLTNTAVALFGTMYPHTGSGIMASYLNGLPFFRNTLVSDLAFTITLAAAIESLSFLSTKIKIQLAHWQTNR